MISAATASSYHCWQCGTTNPLSHDTLCQRALMEGEAEAIRDAVGDEAVCDRCGLRHGVVWFAPNDLWNAVMRGGERGNPDEFGFCCPLCFMRLAEERIGPMVFKVGQEVCE